MYDSGRLIEQGPLPYVLQGSTIFVTAATYEKVAAARTEPEAIEALGLTMEDARELVQDRTRLSIECCNDLIR